MKQRSPAVVALFDKNRWSGYTKHSNEMFDRETFQTLLYSDVAISVDYANQTFSVVKNRYGYDDKIKNAPMIFMTTFISDPELDTMEKLNNKFAQKPSHIGSDTNNSNNIKPKQTLFTWEEPHFEHRTGVSYFKSKQNRRKKVSIQKTDSTS